MQRLLHTDTQSTPTLRYSTVPMRRFHGCAIVLQFSLWIARLDGVLEPPCLPLWGIEPGGGEGKLDYDVVSVSLAEEPFFLSNPLVPTVAGCSSGLETPVSMRNLLGETFHECCLWIRMYAVLIQKLRCISKARAYNRALNDVQYVRNVNFRNYQCRFLPFSSACLRAASKDFPTPENETGHGPSSFGKRHRESSTLDRGFFQLT